MPLGAARITLLAKTQVTAVAEVIRKKVGVTAVGNAQIDTAQSNFGGASALFDGTGDYLTIDASYNSTFSFTGDFTIEVWVRATVLADYNLIISNWAPGFYFGIWGSTGARFYANNALIINASSTWTTNTWYHMSVVRSGTTVTMYKDGTSIGTGTLSGTVSLSDFTTIGANTNNGTPAQFWNGHMDEVRISNTARYTANFTPSTTPFVNDENTLLLLHMNGTDASTFFEDDNGVRAPISVIAAGNAQIDTAQSKFSGASALFDGTDDYLIVTPPSSTYFDATVASGPRTFECWVRSNNIADSLKTIMTNRSYGATAKGWRLGMSNSDGTSGELQLVLWDSAGSADVVYSSNAISLDTWHHIAYVWDGTNNNSVYIDGVKGIDWTASDTAPTEYASLIIGDELGGSGREWSSHIDEVRISNTARYTTNFTPSTTPFVNDTNTLLLLHMDGTDSSTFFEDDNGTVRSAMGVTSINSATVSTTQSKFGGASLSLSATDRNLQVSNDVVDWDVIGANSGDYTIEGWIYCTNNATTNVIFGSRTSTAQQGWDLEVRTNNGNGTLRWFNADSNLYYSSGGVISNNTWHHVAVVKQGSSVVVYVDGTSVISDSPSSYTASNAPLYIGVSGYPTLNVFYGYIDEVRVSNNARYTANFTAPTEPFQNDTNTLLLLHMDGTDGSTVFVDDNGVPPDYSY